nr:MAG TPA: hypothetical protein [Caudoviricetes sp.]
MLPGGAGAQTRMCTMVFFTHFLSSHCTIRFCALSS